MKKQVIIPAAGFGKRMNMAPNQSKEMLLVNGKPMIDWAIQHCIDAGLEVVVNTRSEKEDLVRHLLSYAKLGQIKLLLDPGDEWADTCLRAANVEYYHSLVLLPDTRFDNIKYVLDLFKHSEGWTKFIGTHTVKDPENWGIIDGNRIVEKPDYACVDTEVYAWGVLGVHKYDFGTIVATKELPLIHDNILDIPLINFRDLTRTGKLD